MGKALLFALLAAGCTEASPVATEDAAPGDGGASGDLASADLAAAPLADEDGDGLPDAEELRLARDYLPFLSVSPQDKCSTGGLLVRVRKHPMDATLIHILYDYLYDQDCGLGSHAGDNEAFGVTVDPAKPAPEGIVAVRAISHQGTPCQRVSECGRCAGLAACATLPRSGVPWPALWPSRDKHGAYVNRAQKCTLVTTCADTCEDNPTPASPPIVNAGEPMRPLVNDLTDEGFITAANGWKNTQLFHFDPWSTSNFGGAGKVSGDLVDDAFLTPACH
jgi:hypothetical protein